MEDAYDNGLHGDISQTQKYIIRHNVVKIVKNYMESEQYKKDCREAIEKWASQLADIKDMPGKRCEFIRNGE